MTLWWVSGGIIVALLTALWLQNGQIKDLNTEISTLNTEIMLKKAALVENEAALKACEATNQANANEAERQRQAALAAANNVAMMRMELNAALADVSRGTERFTDEILVTPYPDDFVNWLRDH